jgi:putative ABC transport system substrate-binding protein
MHRRTFIGGSAAILAAPSSVRDALAEQPTKLPLIGFLGLASPGPFAHVLAAFRQGLRETGYVEGQKLAVECRWAENNYDRLPAAAADLVSRQVDVIVTQGSLPPALAAKRATTTIQIVFVTGADPVAKGLVASLAHPGGNLTGFTLIRAELMPKRLELLSELFPQARLFALLVKPDNPETERIVRDTREAAHAKRLRLQILKASDEGEIDDAFTSLAQMQTDALLVGADPLFFTVPPTILARADEVIE